MATVYLLVGVPSSGKSWVSDQLKEQYNVIEHDTYKMKPQYIAALLSAASKGSTKPILANTPFGMSELQSSLAAMGHKVNPVFIIEQPDTLVKRYMARGGGEIPKGHLTRQETYISRAEELKAFKGTSSDVLNHLQQNVVLDRAQPPVQQPTATYKDARVEALYQSHKSMKLGV